MYSAVASRTREIATLRAVGFGAASVMREALLLCLAGAGLGIAVAWLAVTGEAFACILGLVGGLFPGIRAARLPVADALRAV